MYSIHAVLLHHEQRHWNTARPTPSGVNVIKTLDSLVVLPGQDTTLTDTAWNRVATAYRDSVDSSVAVTHAFKDVYPNCQVVR